MYKSANKCKANVYNVQTVQIYISKLIECYLCVSLCFSVLYAQPPFLADLHHIWHEASVYPSYGQTEHCRREDRLPQARVVERHRWTVGGCTASSNI